MKDNSNRANSGRMCHVKSWLLWKGEEIYGVKYPLGDLRKRGPKPWPLSQGPFRFGKTWHVIPIMELFL